MAKVTRWDRHEKLWSIRLIKCHLKIVVKVLSALIDWIHNFNDWLTIVAYKEIVRSERKQDNATTN